MNFQVESTAKKPSKVLLEKMDLKPKIYSTKTQGGTHIIEFIPEPDVDIQQCQVPFEETLFRPEPPNLVIEKFIPFKTYELVFNFRNMDKVKYV